MTDITPRRLVRSLTAMSTLVAIVVEGAIVYRVWIRPATGYGDFFHYEVPVITALPLLLCLILQFLVLKAEKRGDMHPRIAASFEALTGILLLITYQAMGDLTRFVR
jgi:hypothetical protein